MSALAQHAAGMYVPCPTASWRIQSRAIAPPRAGNVGRSKLVDQKSSTSSTSKNPTPPRRCLRCSVFASSSNNDNETSTSSSPSPSSAEEDLEREEENVWALKPVWCQPPTIVATGIFVIAGADVVGGKWLSLAVAAGVCVWWWTFLVEYPKAYRDYIRGTRHKGGFARSADVEEFYSSGSEDERKE